MANLLRTGDAHRWMEGGHRGKANGPLFDRCTNCGLWWDQRFVSKRPVGGCLTSIDVRTVGRSREKDYLEQEVRLRVGGEWPGNNS